ncbi:hypothetical protein [Psychroserpens ponticola]|uniref:Uncharacterized protein n=1 Tax=Psychroserpens ponticola TaxID=2932268 RepID=A0ABY7RVF6_9FLAO|nr:hypothetical protein [Psychroserpens ponticola]WCO01089.1 hypothetical protein MUN68_013575 [Psychroserpens ponticola]
MGSISSMNATINNNRKLLKNGKRKPFTKMNGASSKKKGYKPYVFPQIEPHKLRRIRIKVKKENRKLLIKKLITATIILLGITYWVWNI